jgi:branched-chain amino acid transport system permease protein
LGFFILLLLALGSIYAILAVGLNLQYGQAGILNFTFYTFAAIGAYMTAVSTMGPPPPTYGAQSYILQWALPWPLGLVVGGLSAAAVGLVVALLAFRRLRHDFLAIVTVSAGYIIFNIVSNDPRLFNGEYGLVGIPSISPSLPFGSVEYTAAMFGISLVVLLGCLWLVRRIYRSPYGRVLRSLREDEVVTASFGKNVFAAQLWAFELGCFIAGVGGGLFVLYLGAWNPNAWAPVESFALMAAVIIGGTGNYYGAILGAFLVGQAVVEGTRFLPTVLAPNTVGAIRNMVIGIVLILIIMYRPAGLLPESLLRRIYPRSRTHGKVKEPLAEATDQ